MTRIFVTGASGFLGQNITPALAARYEIFAGYLSHTPAPVHGSPVAVDITLHEELGRLFDLVAPDLVVHAAAMANPDECERNPGKATRVIVEGTRNVTRLCRAHGCRLVHISTDLVFDGRRGFYIEGDPVGAPGIYAGSKVEAEEIVREITPSATILRAALLYGRGTVTRPGYIESTLQAWRDGRPGVFFTDQYRTPLFAPQLADIIDALVARPDFRGILHAGGGERVSRHGFAQLLARRVNAPAELIRAGSMWDNRAAAPRGADCSLVSDRLERELGIVPLTCSEGLDLLAGEGYLKPLSDGTSPSR
jgi:dTDP-4-dehydrorhamnose reductase